MYLQNMVLTFNITKPRLNIKNSAILVDYKLQLYCFVSNFSLQIEVKLKSRPRATSVSTVPLTVIRITPITFKNHNDH